jgi:hypothetical protein
MSVRSQILVYDNEDDAILMGKNLTIMKTNFKKSPF